VAPRLKAEGAFNPRSEAFVEPVSKGCHQSRLIFSQNLMPYCPSCGAEFRAGFTTCNTCHTPLVASLDEPEEEVSAAIEADDDAVETIKPLGVFGDEAQAMLIRRLLDEADIPTVVHGGHAHQIGQCTPWRIFVDEDYFDSARETLASYQSATLLTGQLEGVLGQFENELGQLGRTRRDLDGQIKAVRESIAALREDLNALNSELEE
jgi:hypothetical protein